MHDGDRASDRRRGPRGRPFVLALVVACVVAGASSAGSARTPAAGARATRDEKPKAHESDYLFDQGKLRTYELNLAPEDLAFLDEAPAREEYVPGTLTLDGETMPVGIRYKGSVGSFLGCTSESTALTGDPTRDLANVTNVSGHKTCQKLSLKVKINWEDSKTELHGVRTLQFHSMNRDPSQMQERLAYSLFREMGAPASRTVHARVLINGEVSGLYLMVEQVDGRFTRYHFEDGTGNLYKEVWPLTTAGRPQVEQAYLGALETNEDEDPSVELMQRFAEDVANAATPAERRRAVKRWMDVDEIVANMVVDRAIGNDDGPAHWRCFAPTSCFVHNFFWYVDPALERAHLIPWDLDATFLATPNPYVTVYDDFGEVSNDCVPVDHGGLMPQRSAACDPLFAAWAGFMGRYERLEQELYDGPLSEKALAARLATWSDQIRDATREAAELHGSVSVEAWEAAVEQLPAVVAARHAR